MVGRRGMVSWFGMRCFAGCGSKGWVSKERCSFGRGDGVKFLRSVEKVKVGY